MSECKYCGKPTRASERTGRPLKYCNKKCANDFHQKKNSTRREGWGEATRKRKEQRQKNIEQFQWYSENWLTVEQVAELLGLESTSAVHHRSKAMGVEYKNIPKPAGGNKSFWDPDDINKLIPKQTKISDDYLTASEAAEYLGHKADGLGNIGKGAFKKAMKEIPFTSLKGVKNGKPFTFKLYKSEDLDIGYEKAKKARALEVKNNKQIRTKQTEERRAIREQEKIAEREAQKKLKQQKIKEESEGLISLQDTMTLLGVGKDYIFNRLTPVKRIFKKPWYDPADVKALKLKLEQEANRERFPELVLKKGCPTENYEKKLFEVRIPNYIKKGTFISNRTGQLKDPFVDAVANNKKWHNNRVNLGLVKKFTCRDCLELLPYTSFGFAPTSHGRSKDCKKCQSAKAREKYNPELQKQRRKKNYVQKIRSIVGTTIKKKISKWRKSYADEITIPMVWEYIEENLGYDAAALCKHLESQFEEWMSWENHGRGTDKKYWQIDHIKPQSKFVYTSLDDPNFLLCWDLSNLRALEQIENIARQNRKIRI